jgi:hypothetical protein
LRFLWWTIGERRILILQRLQCIRRPFAMERYPVVASPGARSPMAEAISLRRASSERHS